MKLHLKTEIEINDKNYLKCSHKCQWCEKESGLYTCKFWQEVVDTGKFDDDDDSYGFERCNNCLNEAY